MDINPGLSRTSAPVPIQTASPGEAEPPYELIADELKDGNIVPFLGAGASLIGTATAGSWNPAAPSRLPTGSELSAQLALATSFPKGEDQQDLAKVCSYFTAISGRKLLRKKLRQLLNHDYQCGPLHKLLASVQAPQVIVVTNYDRLVEQAFQEMNKPYDLVIYPSELRDFIGVLWWPHGATEPQKVAANKLDIDLSKRTVIFKMHGTVALSKPEWDNFVISEEDYVEFLSRMTTNDAIPSLFYKYFDDRRFLFLGYSLRDWNLRVLLKNLERSLARAGEEEDSRSWAIQRNPSEVERRLWERRKVTIFEVDLGQFVDRLMKQLGG